MTFKEIIDLTKNKIDEIGTDSQIELIIKNAINHSYLFDLSKLDKRLTVTYIPVISGIATLPDDLDTIEVLTPSLIANERRVGNTIISNRDITFTIIYSILRDELVDDNDEPDLNKKLQYLLVTYGVYAYYMHKKKNQLAQQYYQEYITELSKLVDGDTLGEETVSNIYDVVGEE